MIRRAFAYILPIAVVMTALSASAQDHSIMFLRQFGDFNHPRAAAWDQQGNLFVVDGGNNRVVKYSPTGDSIACVTGSGWGDTQFDTPNGIAILGIDVYVSDYGNSRIQRFDRNLNFVATLYTRDNPDQNARFGYPRGVAVSSQGDLFVLDGENIRIVKVNAFNKIERVFGNVDAGAEQLADPKEIVTDGSDKIYIVDGDALKAFDVFGNPVGTLKGLFALPIRGCAANGNTLFVLSDSVVTAITMGDEQSVRVLPIPDRHDWTGIAVSPKNIALLDDHNVYIYTRETQ
jgi:sugar lactone lactonase YvrE